MRIRNILICPVLTACLSFIAAAQAPAPASPPAKVAPAKSLDALLTGLEKDLVPLAEAMPADKYGFAPSADLFKSGTNADYKGVRTFAQMIAHLTQANYFFSLGMQGVQSPDEATGAKIKAVGTLTAKDDLVKALKDSFASAHTAIATLTPENAWDHAGRGPDDTRAELVGYAVAHARDHYGQLVEYLRMNGIVPPASQGRPLANPDKAN